MKCRYCGADIMDSNGRCEFCGNYQDEPNYSIPNNYEQSNMTKNDKKLINKIVLFSVIGISFLVIITILLVFLLSASNSPKYKFEGKWSCSNGAIKLEFDSKNFYYNADSTKVDATYEIEYDEYKESPIGNYYKYGLKVTTTNRVLNGEKYTEPYTTEYEINIEEGKEDELLMINASTYNMYECYRMDE